MVPYGQRDRTDSPLQLLAKLQEAGPECLSALREANSPWKQATVKVADLGAPPQPSGRRRTGRRFQMMRSCSESR